MGDRDDGPDWEVTCLNLIEIGACDDAMILSLRKLSELQESSYNLISGLFKFISQTDKDSIRYNASVTVLNYIASKCQVDDIVVDLIQISSENLNVEQFGIMLELYLKLFNRSSKRNEIFLDWVLSYIRIYMQEVFSSNDSSNLKLLNFTLFLSFIEKLVPLFSSVLDKVKTLLTNAVLFMIDKNIPDSERVNAVKLILTISPDPFALLILLNEGRASESPDESSDVISLRSYANFFFVVLTLDEVSYPQVYSQRFLFLSLLPVFADLLDDNSVTIVCNGLCLLEKFTPLLKNYLNLSDLSPSVGHLLEKINHTMVYCEHRAIRIRALKSFEAVIDCYDIKAQYHLFLHFRASVSHAGTLALIISKIKNLFDLSRKNPNLHTHNFFSGKRLFDIVKTYGYLTRGKDTDIVSDADQILAALNFFWYLVTMIQKANVNAPDFISDLELNYLNPLKTLIAIGLEYCEKELRKIHDGEPLVDNNVGVTVNNLPVPNFSTQEQLQSVCCSRNAIELIQISLGRILDIIDE